MEALQKLRYHLEEAQKALEAIERKNQGSTALEREWEELLRKGVDGREQ